MDVSAWHDRWEQGRIGFHQERVNPHLVRHWPDLDLHGTEQVLVPMCGASLDMRWLAGRGHAVLGVEISSIAVQRFFESAHMEAKSHPRAGFSVHRFGGLELWCGDFFDLEPTHTQGVRALYDRAALVAMDADDRQRYVAHLARLLAAGTVGLLICLEITEGALQGPPFSVEEAEVHRLLDPHFHVERIETVDVTEESQRLVERGGQRLQESVYRLRRSPGD